MEMQVTNENDVPVCTKKASSIKAIDKKSVHRICSGQVVLTLATAVKELVENSIDAGATNVEVKLKDYGCESIEVIDNGSGVKEENFEGLTLKHHTSKLSDFEDLVNVSTFGFRGEALSSLCALSHMVITTRHKSAEIGTQLKYDLNGKILSRKIVPKPVGTVVNIQNLFHSLPVRHREFQRNLKREFARLIQVLNAYCLINTGARISCVNQTTKGNRTTVVSTNGNLSIRENISNVFGSKQLLNLLELKQLDPQENICCEYGIKVPTNSPDFTFSGFVSSCVHGQGRSCNDRQFVFINKRPCDVTKILKLINEVYHSYNRHQFPFVCICIEMKKEAVDVNVTPDKRQIFLDGEKLLLAVLKTSLIELFEPTNSVYKVNNSTGSSLDVSSSFTTKPPLLSSLSSPIPPSSQSKPSVSHSLTELKRSFSSAFDKDKDSPVFDSNSNKKVKSPFSFSSPFTRKCSDDASNAGSIKQYFIASGNKKSSKEEINYDRSKSKGQSVILHTQAASDSGNSVVNNHQFNDEIIEMRGSELDQRSSAEDEYEATIGVKEESHLEKECFGKRDDRSPQDDDLMTEQGCGQVEGIPVIDMKFEEAREHHSPKSEHGKDQEASRCSPTREAASEESKRLSDSERDHQENHLDLESKEPEPTRPRKELVVHFSLDVIRERWKKLHSADKSSSASFSRSFRAKIAPGDNKSAEEELEREISKEMFAKMEILGQFNLGFIITKHGSDLFIVDQHATDEKYNFEMLQRNHVLQSQKMIVPQNLDLTSSNETILLDSLDVFKKNGFDFLIQPEAPPTQRVKLVSSPVSKNWSFGKEDIEELLFMLMDSPNVMCRPSRVRMMFASRACRKSIMIGTALNKNEMKRLVTHMGEIEQPWNCPHGRPTMRHLFNLKMLPP